MRAALKASWSNNLPRSLTSFIGRESECERIAAALAGTRLLALTGPGGAGKTRLAAEVARRSRALFPDGGWWVELALLADGAPVGDALADVLGVRPLPGRTAAQAVVDRLRSDRAMIVLDNCEHVIGDAAELAEELVRACPRVTVLVTSREALGTAGASDWLVPPLVLPEGASTDRVTAATVWSSDAGRVFVERARQARASFVLDDGNAATVARVCRELDGNPLAIELAAARVQMFSVEQISERLGDRFRLLTTGPRGASDRQRTLRQSVDWSHQLLTEHERVLFRRLAVFAGSWSIEAVESVCTDAVLEREAALDLQGSLVAKSLALVEERDGVARYRLLETVRQYALEILDRSGELVGLRDRHLDYFLERAEAAALELETPRNLAWLDLLDPDAANIEAAISHGAHRAPEKALRVGVGLTMWWNLRGHFAAGQTALERALDAAPDDPSPLRARALWSRAHLASYRGEYETAVVSFQHALAMAESFGDESTRARALYSLAALGLSLDPRAARLSLRTASDLARQAGDGWAEMSALTTIAWSHLMTEEFAAAELGFDEAAPATERTGLEGAVWAYLGLGWCALAAGEHARARAGFENAISTARLLGDPVTEGFGHVLLTRLDLMRGELEAALGRARATEASAVATGAFMVLPSARIELARALGAAGRGAEARELLDAVVADGADQGWMLCDALLTLADVMRVLGDSAAALAGAQQGLEVSRRIGAATFTASARESLAWLASERGDWRRAEALVHEALEHRATAGTVDRLVQLLEQLAQVTAGLESFEDAARLTGAADRARTDLGLVRLPVDASAYAAREEVLRARLGVEGFATAMAQGAALSLSEAVAWVRRGRGRRNRPPSGWASLTPTESRVVELVSRGLTNPQIAGRMLVSPATVKVHLAHVFGKLAVRSRSELAAMAVRDGVVGSAP